MPPIPRAYHSLVVHPPDAGLRIVGFFHRIPALAHTRNRGRGELAHIKRSARVPYSPEAMFDLVNDVDSYPQFLPWCRSAAVLEQGDGWRRARIEMAKGPLHRSFTTRNELERGRRIRVRLEDGPFRKLSGDWHFDPVGDNGCQISLDLEFEFAGAFLHRVLGPVFNQIASTLVDSFCRRAREIHGRRR